MESTSLKEKKQRKMLHVALIVFVLTKWMVFTKMGLIPNFLSFDFLEAK